MKRIAGIYCRISQDREGAGLGVDRQRQDCEALAGQLGWSVGAVHEDNDLSAHSGKPRPGYRALLVDVREGRVNAVLAWHTDRIHRSPLELEEYIDTCEPRNVVTATVKAGPLDLSTPSGRMVARQLCAVARFESEHKAERVRRAQQQVVEQGGWRGGNRPFGFEDDGVTVRYSEAAEIIRCYHELLAGASLGSLAADLNRRGILSVYGKQWNYTTLRQMLKRARNAGFAEYNGELYPARWPALVPEETWRAVCGIFGDPERRTSVSNRARWLGAGLYVCGAEGCGQTVKTGGTTSNRRTGTSRVIYRCSAPGTGHVARTAVPVDEFVERVIRARFSRDDARDLLEDEEAPNAEELRAKALTLRQRLVEVAVLHSDDEMTTAQFRIENKRIRGRLADIERQQAHVSRAPILADLVNSENIEDDWGSLSLERQRAVVNALVTVTILPSGRRGSRFDEDLVRINWKV